MDPLPPGFRKALDAIRKGCPNPENPQGVQYGGGGPGFCIFGGAVKKKWGKGRKKENRRKEKEGKGEKKEKRKKDETRDRDIRRVTRGSFFNQISIL